MYLFNFNNLEIMSFMLVLVRVSAMMLWFPIFGDRSTPPMVKILFSFVVSLIIYPVVKIYIGKGIGTEIVSTILYMVQEITIGVLISVIARCIFYTLSYASQIMSFQMGFGMVSVIDPNLGNRVSIINQFQVIVATLLFLVVNAHHVFFESIIISYQQVAPGTFSMSDGFFKEIVSITSMVFVVGFKIAAPIAGVLLVTNAAFGVVSRAVPQMNIFMVSFPITIAVGLIFIGFSIPILAELLGNEFGNIGDNIIKILKTV